MNPLEFNWTEDQQVTVKNPTEEKFVWKVHGQQYEVEAGAQANMPGYIAWLYVYEQAFKKAQAADKGSRWNEEEFRKEYYESFVVNVQPLVAPVAAVEPSLVQPVDNAEPDEPDAPVESSEPPSTSTVVPTQAQQPIQPMKPKPVKAK